MGEWLGHFLMGDRFNASLMDVIGLVAAGYYLRGLLDRTKGGDDK